MVHKRKRTKIKSPGLTELPHLPLDVPGLTHDYRHYFAYSPRPEQVLLFVNYYYKALALTVRDRLMDRWRNTRYSLHRIPLQAGLLPVAGVSDGADPCNAMLNLGITDAATQAMHGLGIKLEELGRIRDRCRTRQRWSRPPGGLFPGQLCHTATAGHWVYGIAMNTACFRQAYRGWTPDREPGPLAT